MIIVMTYDLRTGKRLYLDACSVMTTVLLSCCSKELTLTLTLITYRMLPDLEGVGFVAQPSRSSSV